MLSEICLYLKNWFDFNQPKYIGRFKIAKNTISYLGGKDMDIQENQYFRIVGSVFNDGVYKNDDNLVLVDEEFTGDVWLMAVPDAVISLSAEIDDWQAKYGGVDSENMSPYQSESFGGYSYSKSSGGNTDASGSSVGTWQSVFGARLRRYKKI